LRSHRRALCWHDNRRTKKNGGGEIFDAGKIRDPGRQKLMRKIRAEQRPSKQRHESDLVPNEEITECTQQKIQGWAAPTAGKIDEKIRARKKNHQNKLRLDLEWSRWHTSPRKQTKTRTQEGSHPAAQKPNKKKEHKKKEQQTA
jgi:hypothetical protein